MQVRSIRMHLLKVFVTDLAVGTLCLHSSGYHCSDTIRCSKVMCGKLAPLSIMLFWLLNGNTFVAGDASFEDLCIHVYVYGHMYIGGVQQRFHIIHRQSSKRTTSVRSQRDIL